MSTSCWFSAYWYAPPIKPTPVLYPSCFLALAFISQVAISLQSLLSRELVTVEKDDFVVILVTHIYVYRTITRDGFAFAFPETSWWPELHRMRSGCTIRLGLVIPVFLEPLSSDVKVPLAQIETATPREIHR